MGIALLSIVPVAPALAYIVGTAPLWVFVAGAVAIGVLADWVRRATEQVAERVGPAVGGPLTVSFGSLAELILAFFVLLGGKPEVVKAQLTGSINGTARFWGHDAALRDNHTSGAPCTYGFGDHIVRDFGMDPLRDSA
jgi:Ca2+/H+ antiporter